MQKPPDFAGIGGQAGKILRKKGLLPIAEGPGGVGVDFHHKTTGAGGYSGPAQRRDPAGYLEELPEQLQDQAGHRLHRFSASARNALRIGSIFYMSALLYPEDHKPGQPDDLQVFIRRLRDEGEHYTLHPQD